MSHVISIATKKQNILDRARILSEIRNFFVDEQILEITAPTLIKHPGQEPNLEPLKVTLTDDTKKQFPAFLHTSPEYTLKKCIAAGLGDVYSMGSAYRNHESFGGIHNPEFTMLEWYRTGTDMIILMDDIEALFARVSTLYPNTVCGVPLKRIHMRDVWQTYVGVNLDDYLDIKSMRTLVIERGYTALEQDSYEALFYTIFLQDIEPHLGMEAPTIIHHYPAPMAALSQLDPADIRYAQRFELYVQGVELANAFTELTDATEQRARLVKEQLERQVRGMTIFPIDEEFVDAVGQLPPCAGIALGVDRFVQLLLGCKTIDDVLVLPASKIFKS
jgi:lysyl-tRNA synthetase class 2